MTENKELNELSGIKILEKNRKIICRKRKIVICISFQKRNYEILIKINKFVKYSY